IFNAPKNVGPKNSISENVSYVVVRKNSMKTMEIRTLHKSAATGSTYSQSCSYTRLPKSLRYLAMPNGYRSSRALHERADTRHKLPRYQKSRLRWHPNSSSVPKPVQPRWPQP